MSPLLTKRRAVDLCRMAACLCRPVLWRGHECWAPSSS